jgi:hypothetical protein
MRSASSFERDRSAPESEVAETSVANSKRDRAPGRDASDNRPTDHSEFHSKSLPHVPLTSTDGRSVSVWSLRVRGHRRRTNTPVGDIDRLNRSFRKDRLGRPRIDVANSQHVVDPHHRANARGSFGCDRNQVGGAAHKVHVRPRGNPFPFGPCYL